MGKKKKQSENGQRLRNDVQRAGESGQVARILSGRYAFWAAAIIYLILTVFLFNDFLFSDKMLYGSDTIPDGIYTRKFYKEHHAEFGGIPRWNPYILGGLPFIDAMHGDTFYPAAWLKFAMPLTRALGHKLVLHVFLAGIFMFLFLRSLKLRNDAAFLGGLMYMLAPSFVSWLYGGHDAKMYVIALLPLAFTFLEKGIEQGKMLWFAALGGIMGLLVLTSQIQTAYYAYWALGLYFLFRLFFPERLTMMATGKRAGMFVFAVILAVTFGAVQLLPSYSFSTTQSVRAGGERTSYEYATSFSMNAEEIGSMIVPSFSGAIDGRFEDGKHKNFYWGKNFFKLNTEYHGILMLVLAALGLAFLRDKRKWFWLFLAALALVYAVGASTPVYRLFYHLVPGVKNFRAPSMIIFLFCFAIASLAASFLSSLLAGNIEAGERGRPLLYVVGGILGVAVVVSVMGESFFSLWKSIFYRAITDGQLKAMQANVPLFIGDLWRVVILAVVTIMGIWMYVTLRIKGLALTGLMALVAIIDGFSINSHFITTIEPAIFSASAPDNTVRELQARLSNEMMPFRTLGLDIFRTKNSSNYYAMFGIPVADGKHNNELQTYDRFKGGRAIENFTRHWLVDGSFVPEGVAANNFLEVAGIRYLVFPSQQGGTQLVENPSALDRAFIVHEAVTVSDDTDAVELLKDPSFEPSRQVVITGEIGRLDAAGQVSSTVKSYSTKKDGFTITAEFGADGYLVLTENMVPYWNASVDGDPVNIEKAYGTFMAVRCPKGVHEVVFSYYSGPYENGKRLTLASLAVIVVSVALFGLNEVKTRKKLPA